MNSLSPRRVTVNDVSAVWSVGAGVTVASTVDSAVMRKSALLAATDMVAKRMTSPTLKPCAAQVEPPTVNLLLELVAAQLVKSELVLLNVATFVARNTASIRSM